jgi:hypothetical protein
MITVDSELGEGSEVIIYLPRAESGEKRMESQHEKGGILSNAAFF